MNQRFDNRPEGIVRRFGRDGALVRADANKEVDPEVRALFFEPPPAQLSHLSASIKASQIANLLLNADYKPDIAQLRLDIDRLRAELPRDPGGCLERTESVKIAVFPCHNSGEMRCAYSIIVMRSVYEPNIIVAAGIIVKEALVEGICELNSATLKSMARDSEFCEATAPLCLCIAPQTQLTITSDVMDKHILALQSTCPLQHHEHRNYAIKKTPKGLAGVDSYLAQQTGLSIDYTCWTQSLAIAEPAEGAISDHRIQLSVYLNENERAYGADKHHTTTFRVTRWPGGDAGEAAYLVVENSGGQPVFMGLFPRRARDSTCNC